ncbi:MAG: fatty acid desaturase CarF family protein [Gemmataceae bacterium]
MQPTQLSLPTHDRVAPLTRAVEVASLVAAFGLLATNICRLAMTPMIASWWFPIILLVGVIVADFLSGLVHWTADTWGRETMPFFGRRFLRPFRVHHVNPDDFLKRDWIDCNGDVAMLSLPLQVGTLIVDLDNELGRFACTFLIAFVAAALPTNQVHQWAHMRPPPALIRRLQNWGLVLSVQQHDQHHRAPHAVNYCITTGWCNRPLALVGFFPALESLVTRWTGLRPRDDDGAFAASVVGPCGERL